MNRARWRTPIVVFACGTIVLLISFGTRTSFGLFLMPVTDGLGWGREAFAFALALQNLLWGLFVPVAGALADKFGPGRVIAAAGATELIVCLMAIRDNVLPPTINYHTPDPPCDLDYIPNQSRETRCQHALSNSFGFGGQNVTLVASRFTG